MAASWLDQANPFAEFRTQLSIYLSAGLNVPLYRVGMALNISYGFEGRRQVRTFQTSPTTADPLVVA